MKSERKQDKMETEKKTIIIIVKIQMAWTDQ